MARMRKYTIKNGSTRWRVAWRTKANGGAEQSLSFDSERDAAQWKALIEKHDGDADTVSHIIHAAREKGVTVAEMIDQFISEYSQGNEQTRAKYRANADNHIIAELGWMPVKDVTVRHIRRFVRTMSDNGKSAKTIHNVVGVLAAALRMAVLDGHISGNPVDAVRLPKIQKKLPPNLSAKQVQTIVESIDPHFALLIEFLAYTGLRWSEAEALQCRDVHENSDGSVFVIVTKAMQDQGSKRHVASPKSSESNRRVALDSVLSVKLAAHVKDRPDDAWLFTMKRGGRLDYARVRRSYLMPALEKSLGGIAVRPHTFRHFHASTLVASGVDPYKVARRLGHSDPAVTLRTYSHLRPDADAETMTALNAIRTAEPAAIAEATGEQMSDEALELLRSLDREVEEG